MEFGIYREEKRKKLIKQEIKRLNPLLENIDSNRKRAFEKLINDAAFMAVTLEEARAIINRDGIIESYQNGQNQYGYKKSSAVEVYDKMINTYSKIVKQMCDVLPENVSAEDPGEEIMKFITGLKK